MKTNYTPSMVIDIFKNNYDAGVYYIECWECCKFTGSIECKNTIECIGFIEELNPIGILEYDIFKGWYIPCSKRKSAMCFRIGSFGVDSFDVPLQSIGDKFFLTRKEAENALRERKRSKN